MIPDDQRSALTEQVREVGDYLQRTFREPRDGPYNHSESDVKIPADRESEEQLVEALQNTFPEYGIWAEEQGWIEQEETYWIVDPLDGTNNFASRIPYYAISLALVEDDGCVFSLVYQPEVDDCYIAEKGKGATVNGDPLPRTSPTELQEGTVSRVLGHHIVGDEQLEANAAQISDAVGATCKRIINTWCPSIDWALAARGELEAVVSYQGDQDEDVAGQLLMEEAGATVLEDEDLIVASLEQEYADRLMEGIRSAL